jgi:23S rRNA (uracil1939-C5)-methyltransferase
VNRVGRLDENSEVIAAPPHGAPIVADGTPPLASKGAPVPLSNSQEDPGPITITGLAAGGDGVGRTSDGRVVFVDGAVPGERVELLDIRIQKRMIRARVGRILAGTPDRVEPKCVHFGTCGGCRWQHVAYSAQLESKRTIVRDALERIGGLSLEQEIEIVPSPEPYGYRARARWVESEKGLGYRVRGSRVVSPVNSCPVLVPSAEKVLSERAAALEDQAPEQGDLPPKKPARPIEWVVTAGAEAAAVVRPARAGASSRGRKASPGSVTIEASGESLRVSSSSFVQGNALLWDAFATTVQAACLGEGGEASSLRFVELYAGVGFFTLPLARRGASGMALESDPSAVADLKFNLHRSGLAPKVEIVSSRAEKRNDLKSRFASADVLLVDPPRIGLEEGVRDEICASGPQRFVYVSCDPATLARDLRALASAGYSICSVQAFDLFPQTPHVETVVRLERN